MNIVIKITRKNPLLGIRTSVIGEDLMHVMTRNHQIARGYVSFNGDKYTIYPSYEYWSLEDYKRQWKEGLERIKTKNRSCLVVDFDYVNDNPSVTLWLLYKKKNKIHIQENFLHSKDIKSAFTPETCYQFIRQYKTHDDGEKIYEIVIPA